MKRLFLLLSASVFIVTFGCDEFGPLDGMFPDSTLRLIQNDTLVKSGSYLDIEMDFSENPPDKVTGRLTGPGGFDRSLTVEAPPDGWSGVSGLPGRIAVPPGLADGYYMLTLAAWREDKLLTETDRRLFITGEEWTIRGLELFPPRAVSGGVFVAKAVLSLPEGSDPWIRWRQDGRLVAEGFLSGGTGRVILQAGSDSDMETISLELLSGVADGEKQVLRTFNTRIYLTDVPEEGPDDLGPPDSYSLLMHFNGILRDDSGQKTLSDLRVLGSPWPVQTPGGMGFRFTPGSGLTAENLSSDFASSSGWLPFSITANILPLTRKSGRIFSLEDGEGFGLEMGFTGYNGLRLSLRNGEMEVLSAFPLEFSGSQPQAITVSLLPGEGYLDLIWQVNGDTRVVERLKSQVEPPEGALRITLGGEDGFDGVITELGILKLSGKEGFSEEADRFKFFSRLFRDVILAEGFEDDLMEPGVIPGGRASIAGGGLVLPPSSSVRFPAEGNLALRFGSFVSGDGWTLALLRKDTGKRQWTSKDTEVIKDPDGYSLRLEKSSWMSDNDAGAFFELTASSQNASNLNLEHILVTRD